MIKRSLLVIVSVLMICLSCKLENKSGQKSGNENQESATKDISELTYPEIFYLLHEEEEYGMDVHGDLFGQAAITEVSLVESAATNCGNAVSLQSSHETENIKVAVRTTFNFPGNPANEIFRAYIIKPGETLPVGHSMLCYQDAEYQINREIASAGFTDEE